jgi:O-antigen/teichoic acid export membrane protein
MSPASQEATLLGPFHGIRHVLWLRVGGFVLQRGLVLAKAAIFARVFTPEAIGTVTLVIGTVAFFGALANLGTRESVIRDQSLDQRRTDTSFTLSLLASATVAALLLLLTVALARFAPGTTLRGWLPLVCVLVFTTPGLFPMYQWERDLRFDRVAVPGIVSELSSLVLTLILWKFSGNAVLSLLLGHVIGFVMSLLWTWTAPGRWPRLRVDPREAWALLAFGLPLALDSLNVQATLVGDNLLVGWLWGNAALGFYSVAWNLPMTIASSLAVLEAMSLPLFAKARDQQGELRRLFNATNKVWAAIGFPLGCLLALYARPIVLYLYGPDWSPTVPILRVMAVSFALRFSTGYAYGPLAVVRGRTAYLLKAGCVSSAFLILVGTPMIAAFGPIGGAWFWLVQLLVLGPLVRFPLIRQELGTLEYLWHGLPPILAGTLATLVAGVIFHLWPGGAGVIVSLLAFVAIYLGALRLVDPELWGWGRAMIPLRAAPSNPWSRP